MSWLIASISVGEVKMVVISKGFCASEVLSGVFTVCKDVRKVCFSVVIEVLYSNIGVVVDGEVDFVCTGGFNRKLCPATRSHRGCCGLFSRYKGPL